MFGAVAGDIVGSIYERSGMKSTKFPLFKKKSSFTDDTILTMATAHAIMNEVDYGTAYKSFALNYPDRGYGGMFNQWAKSLELQPSYNSFGNGSAMRVGPIGFAFDRLEDVLEQARLSAICTHSHEEAIRGAQTVAAAIWYARHKKNRNEIRTLIAEMSGYNLSRTIEEIRPDYKFNVTCQGSVPEAIIAFLDSTTFEEAIRLAISLGGDSDTIACIAGEIAEAYYKTLPKKIIKSVWKKLPIPFRHILYDFYRYLNVI